MHVAWLIPVLAGLMGLLLGSFLNVCIARLPAGESVVAPRSKCPVCGAPIQWYDNVPLLSFAALRRRCRACGVRISWLYPAVELATGAWFATCAVPLAGRVAAGGALTQVVLEQLGACVLGWLLIGLAVIDWKHQILPDALTYTGIAAGVFLACVQAVFLGDDQDNVILQHPPNLNSANAGRSPGNIFLTGPEHLIFGRLFAAVGAFLLLYLVRVGYRAVRKRDGMGLGDAKLLAMIAAFVGIEQTLAALFAGLLFAVLFAAGLAARGRARLATRLPFGSFLAAGGLVAVVFGPAVLQWYTGMFSQ